MVNGFLVCMSLVSMSLYYFRVASQLLQCYNKTDDVKSEVSRNLNRADIGDECWTKTDDVKFEVSHNLNRADIEDKCWIDHPIYGLALLELIVFICVSSVPTINALLSDYTSFGIIMNPVNTSVYILAFPTYMAFFSAYSISRYADLTWGQRPTVVQECSAVPDNVPKCSRCNLPCAQGHSEYCEDHAWLQGNVRLCEWAAYFLVIVNVSATAAFLHVSPVILIAIIYVNGTILAILAMARTLGKCAKRLSRVVCCSAPTIPREPSLDVLSWPSVRPLRDGR